jgi:hypothetical protein
MVIKYCYFTDSFFTALRAWHHGEKQHLESIAGEYIMIATND